jgi:EAL domain-containing protein (putative c-di-GMP-specific phosphodiesterase class I)
MKTVAEGVENETQLAFLKKFGCDLAQGYFFTKPIPLDAFIEWLGREGGSAAALDHADNKLEE